MSNISAVRDEEKLYADEIYVNGNNFHLSELDAVIRPGIRVNFYSTTGKEAFATDGTHLYPFIIDTRIGEQYLYRNFGNKKGYIIVETVYYNNISLENLKKIKQFYNIKKDNLTTNKLTEIIDKGGNSFNIRNTYFIPEEMLEKNEIVHLSGLSISKSIDALISEETKEAPVSTNTIPEDKKAVIKFFYVEVMTHDDYKELTLFNGDKLKVPVLKDPENYPGITEGIYMEVNGEAKPLLPESFDLFVLDIRECLRKFRDLTKVEVDKKVELESICRKRFRELIRDKYQSFIEENNNLNEQRFKIKSEILKHIQTLEIMEQKANLERLKGENEAFSKQSKQDISVISGLVNLVKDVLKII